MVDKYAKLIGIVLLFIGIAGFIAPITPDNHLFGTFMINIRHNIVHLLSGAILLAIGLSPNCTLIRRTVLLFAVIYGIIAILGFVNPQNVWGMPMNMADNILHLGIAASALAFALPERHSIAH